MDLSVYVRHGRQQYASRSAPAPDAEPPKSNVALTGRALRLLATIEAARRPKAVFASYPHLLNRLADLWDAPENVERYLEGLLLTGRADRRGFPPAVVAELAELREKNRRRLSPVRQDVWSEAMLR